MGGGTGGAEEGDEERGDDDDFPAEFVREDGEEDESGDAADELSGEDGVADVLLFAVELCVMGDGEGLFYGAGGDDGAGVDFFDVGVGAAGEGGGHEEVAGEEDGEGDDEPLGGDEDDGVDLVFVSVAGLLEQGLGLHDWI